MGLAGGGAANSGGAANGGAAEGGAAEGGAAKGVATKGGAAEGGAAEGGAAKGGAAKGGAAKGGAPVAAAAATRVQQPEPAPEKRPRLEPAKPPQPLNRFEALNWGDVNRQYRVLSFKESLCVVLHGVCVLLWRVDLM
jgi:hypothetical protein